MHKIYRVSDRVNVKIDDITIVISPLTYAQKAELQTTLFAAAKNPAAVVDGAFKAIKYGVKGLKGVVDSEGNPYEVQLDGDSLSDECVNDLLNLQIQDRLIPVCISLLNGIPTAFVHPQTREPLQGVSIEASKGPKSKHQSK